MTKIKQAVNKIIKKRLKLKQLVKLTQLTSSQIKKLDSVDKKQYRKLLNEKKTLKRSVKDLQTYISYLIQEAEEEQQLLLTPIVIGTIHQYRYKARFIFSQEDLPKVKGYSILCEKGFYSKNNILGVVKDHRISIKFGFENNIPPEIIGHPANCEFMYYSQNASKSSNSSLLLEDLLELINNW